MIPKCKKFLWNVEKKKVRKYFPLFPFFPSLVCFLARESEMRKRERERTTKRVCRARRIFEANLTGFPPSFQPSKITEGDRDRFCDCAPCASRILAHSDELVTKNAHEMNPVGEGGEKEKEKKRWRTRNKKNGKRKGEKKIAGRG